jgi:hypothetical protein
MAKLSAIKSENLRGRQTEFLRDLLSLRKMLQEEVPDAHYVQTGMDSLRLDPETSTHLEKGI